MDDDKYIATIRCRKCGEEYTIDIRYPVRAPHGTDKSCASNAWEVVEEHE